MLQTTPNLSQSLQPVATAPSRKKIFLRNTLMVVAFAVLYYPVGLPRLNEPKPPVPAHDRHELPNFHTVNPYLFRGGAPSLKGVDAVKAMGVSTIVDLRRDPTQILVERWHCEKIGINYISLPMGDFVPDAATRNTYLNAVQKAFQDPKNGKVFLHCSHGSDRTSFMVAMWRVLHNRWTIAEAFGEMLERGFLIHKLRKDDRSKDIFN